jgi:hypothetical protein
MDHSIQSKPALVIEPTIGRRVLVFVGAPHAGGVYSPSVPFDCGIAYVWGSGVGEDGAPFSTINVGGVNHAGQPFSATSVILKDRAQDETDHHGHGGGTYAVWMPYRFEQAQRAAAKAAAGGVSTDGISSGGTGA